MNVIGIPTTEVTGQPLLLANVTCSGLPNPVSSCAVCDGGDEFSLLAPDADAMSVRRLVKRLSDTLPAGITASIGFATWDRTQNAADLLRRADQAMYETKQRRKSPRNA